jgi:hypothetical protein
VVDNPVLPGVFPQKVNGPGIMPERIGILLKEGLRESNR